MRQTRRLTPFALLTAASTLAISTAALAQEAAAPPTQGVEEIVVTARRREESLKDVPVAVSAFTADRLDRAGALDITTLQQTTPNTTVQVARGSNSTLISFIRGVGQQDPLWGFEPGVGLYLDDVYVARPQGAVLDIFDVQRIEVLRGPQGTLYGRNTIGGAIKYVTNRLGDDLAFKARGTVGSYNQVDMSATGVVPLGGGLSVGGSVAHYQRDGYGENITTGMDQYNKKVDAFRLSAEWAPNEDFFFRLAYDKVIDKSNPRHGHRELPALAGGFRVLPDEYDTQAGMTGLNEVRTEGWSATAQWNATNELTFKSITANRKGRTDTIIDFDNTPLPTLDIPAYYQDSTFTQELQALYTGSRLQGVFGLYLLNGYAEGAFDTIAGNLGVSIASAGKVSTTSYAAFGDLSYDITDRLKASVGGRWTKDKKTANVFRAQYLGATRSPILGGAQRPVLSLRTNYVRQASFDEFTPRFSLSYELTPELTTYASYSKGFKSGGFDMRGDAVLTPQTVDGYDPEYVDAYELGLKGTAFDRRLSFASDVFLSKYKGQQFTTQVPVPTGIASSVDNAGRSTIYGAEIEGSAILGGGFTLNAAGGYINAQFDEFLRFDPATRQNINVADLYVFQNTPKWTGNLALNWMGEVAGGTVNISPMISYRSAYAQFEQRNPVLDQKGYALVDLTMSWQSPDRRYKLTLAGKNLTDERYKIGGYAFPGAVFNDSMIAFYGPPRTVMATIDISL